MNSVLSRLNGLFAFTLTVLGTITFLCYLSTAFNDRSNSSASAGIAPSFTVSVTRIPHHRSHEQHDMGNVLLDISADFSHLFDWNTKELFVYVVAEYKSGKNPINQVVLWDKVILRGQNSSLAVPIAPPKYPFIDNGRGIRGNKNVSLSLCWNVIPLAGQLPLVCSGASLVQFPNQYTS